MRITGMYESNNAADNGAAATVRTAAQAVSRLPLRDSIENAVQNYVSSGRNDGSLYEEVLSTMEHPLLDAVMQATRGNQTRAAVLLGINRGTLRKKLKKYGIN
jgi:Fis family transcriptional regulator